MQNLRSGVQSQSDKDCKDDDLDPEYDVEHRAEASIVAFHGCSDAGGLTCLHNVTPNVVAMKRKAALSYYHKKHDCP